MVSSDLWATKISCLAVISWKIPFSSPVTQDILKIYLHQVGLHPILVLAYLTLLPYIFFLGILPARTLRRAINSGHPNRFWSAAP